MDAERVVIAGLVRPRGIRGEVIARSETDVPHRLETLTEAKARLSDESEITLRIEKAWRHKDDWVLKFTGIDSIEAAERLRGADLWVPRQERGTLPDGEFFRSDLIGCTVVDAVTGNALGVIEGWQQYGGPPLIELTIAGREVLIPFVSSLCRRVDLEHKRVELEIAEGLLDL